MTFTFDSRLSDSPFVQQIWRTQSDTTPSFTSLAATQWEIVVMKQYGKTTISVKGPETQARLAPIPENAEFLGITFKLGTFMPHLPVSCLVDGGIDLPQSMSTSFWLQGGTWQIPDFENADTFVNRLVHEGVLMREPVVEAALQGHLRDLSLRSVQRRFLRTTGLTHAAIYQIERAYRAMDLLSHGVSILDTVELAGYADQPHLTRSLKRFMGQTPSQISAIINS